MPVIDLEMTVGNRRPSWQPTLKDRAGAPVTLTTPALLMVAENGTGPAKINYAAMAVVTAGVARYDWAAADVDTPGIFYLWVRDTDGAGRTWTWPFGGRSYRVRFSEAK